MLDTLIAINPRLVPGQDRLRTVTYGQQQFLRVKILRLNKIAPD